MADINAVNLTPETLSTLDGTENIVAFDVAEGKKIPLSVLGDYVVQKLTETLLGKSQTLQDAFGQCESLVGVTPIPANSDLDDYVEVGNYYTDTAAIAETIDNIPIDAVCLITVRKAKNNANNVIQVVQPYNAFNQMWFRNVNVSTHVPTTWTRSAVQSDIPNKYVVPSNSTLAFSVPNYSSHFVVLAGQNANSHATYIVSQPSTNYPARVSEVFKATDGTVSMAASENNHEVVVTNGSGHDLGVMVITFRGNILTEVLETS